MLQPAASYFILFFTGVPRIKKKKKRERYGFRNHSASPWSGIPRIHRTACIAVGSLFYVYGTYFTLVLLCTAQSLSITSCYPDCHVAFAYVYVFIRSPDWASSRRSFRLCHGLMLFFSCIRLPPPWQRRKDQSQIHKPPLARNHVVSEAKQRSFVRSTKKSLGVFFPCDLSILSSRNVLFASINTSSLEPSGKTPEYQKQGFVLDCSHFWTLVRHTTYRVAPHAKHVQETQDKTPKKKKKPFFQETMVVVTDHLFAFCLLPLYLLLLHVRHVLAS